MSISQKQKHNSFIIFFFRTKTYRQNIFNIKLEQEQNQTITKYQEKKTHRMNVKAYLLTTKSMS